MTTPSRHDREAIFSKVCRLVETKHFNPKLNGVDWNSVVEARRDRVLRIESPEEFEKEMHELVSQLKTSHTGFFHRSARRGRGWLTAQTGPSTALPSTAAPFAKALRVNRTSPGSEERKTGRRAASSGSSTKRLSPAGAGFCPRAPSALRLRSGSSTLTPA
ncbi:MAG: hypothetical protein ACRD4D_01045 [Candidatus Acidiferrales bacterium]